MSKRTKTAIVSALVLPFLGAGLALGCSSSEGVGNVLSGLACDAFTIDTDPSCVCCSNQPGQCETGVSPCAPKGASPTCGDPCPEGLTCTTVNGQRVCGTESKCVGKDTQSCGSCGTQTRTCNEGSWSDWSACSGQGECAPGSIESCGAGRTRTCDSSCTFGACVAECQSGESQTQACGSCGTMTRTCTGEGAWSEWSSCTGEGECPAGSVEACASGTRTCSATCSWGACLECQPGQSDARACGNACGSESRTCTASGTWGEWSSCVDAGVCTPGARQACSGGYQECTSSCQWSGCITAQCVPGTQAEVPCGNCGTGTAVCQDTGTYAEPVSCNGQGACSPGSAQGCGTDGIQTCTASCAWDTCLPIECTSGQVGTEACGLCGERTRNCVNGRWTPFSECIDGGVCEPNTSEACGTGGTRTCLSSCQWGGCTGQTCDGPFVQSCGVCGIQTRVCNNGEWSQFSACNGERDCIPGTVEDCGGSTSRTCNFQCYWDACQ